MNRRLLSVAPVDDPYGAERRVVLVGADPYGADAAYMRSALEAAAADGVERHAWGDQAPGLIRNDHVERVERLIAA